MPVLDYKAYAKSPKGLAARAKAHIKSSAKRKERAQQSRALKVKPQPLLQALANWR